MIGKCLHVVYIIGFCDRKTGGRGRGQKQATVEFWHAEIGVLYITMLTMAVCDDTSEGTSSTQKPGRCSCFDKAWYD